MNFKCVLTDEGNSTVLTTLVKGGNIEFTKIEIGCGKNENPQQSKALAQPKINGQLLTVKSNEDGSATINFFFDNKEVDEQFNFTEFGIFAKYENQTNEFLYAYGYSIDDIGEVIPKLTDANSYVKENIFATLKIGSPESVNVYLGEYEDYASKATLEEHQKNVNNPHNVTAEQIGLGNVENVSVDDARPNFAESAEFKNVNLGDTTSTLWGKVKKMFTKLSEHLSNYNNPHSTTWQQLAAASGGMPLPSRYGGTGASSIAEFKKITNQDVVINYRNNISFTSNVYNIYLEGFWKQNNTAFIFVSFQLRDKLSGNPNYLICTLPQGLRPISPICVPCQTNEQGDTPTASIQFNENGQVKLYSFGHLNLPENTFYRFTAVFPTAE